MFWTHVGHCGEPAVGAPSLHFVTLFGRACWGRIWACAGRMYIASEGAGAVFFPQGILDKLCVVCLDFDCDLSYEVKCGIFHLWYHVGARKCSDFGLQIFSLGMLNLCRHHHFLLNLPLPISWNEDCWTNTTLSEPWGKSQGNFRDLGPNIFELLEHLLS